MREFVMIRSYDIFHAGGLRISTEGCGCCATDVYFPSPDFREEIQPTEAELKLMTDYLLDQIDMVAALKSRLYGP